MCELSFPTLGRLPTLFVHAGRPTTPGAPIFSNIGFDTFSIWRPEFEQAVPLHPVEEFIVRVTEIDAGSPEFIRVQFPSSVFVVRNVTMPSTPYEVCISAVFQGFQSPFGPCAIVTTRGKGS